MDHDGLFDDEDFFSNPMDSFSTLRDIEDMVIFGTNSSQEDGTTRQESGLVNPSEEVVTFIWPKVSPSRDKGKEVLVVGDAFGVHSGGPLLLMFLSHRKAKVTEENFQYNLIVASVLCIAMEAGKEGDLDMIRENCEEFEEEYINELSDLMALD